MFGANYNTSWFNALVHSVGAVIAFGSCLRIRVNIQRIIWARLGTGFAANASIVIKINDAVLPSVEGSYGTNSGTWSIVAVIAAHY